MSKLNYINNTEPQFPIYWISALETDKTNGQSSL